MVTKQTAVEWLKEQFIWMIEDGVDWFDAFHSVMSKLEQAKQMEKEQMEKCFLDGDSDGFRRCYYHGYDGLDFEQYYNETYGKE